MKHILIVTLLALCGGCFEDYYRVPSEYVDFRCSDSGKTEMLFENPDKTRTWYNTEKPCGQWAKTVRRIEAEKEKQ